MCTKDQTKQYYAEKSLAMHKIASAISSIQVKLNRVQRVTECGASIQSIKGLRVIQNILKQIDISLNNIPAKESCVELCSGLSNYPIDAIEEPDLARMAKSRLEAVCTAIDATNTALSPRSKDPEIYPKYAYLHFLYNTG
jgi:hypothetical protein